MVDAEKGGDDFIQEAVAFTVVVPMLNAVAPVENFEVSMLMFLFFALVTCYVIYVMIN